MSLAFFAYRVAVISVLILVAVFTVLDLSNVEAEGFIRSVFCRAFPRATGC